MPSPQELGRYIYLANPYQAVPLAPNQNWPNPSMSPMTYPAGADRWYGPCLDEVETQQYPGYFKFKGADRYVALAIRIPYMYYRATPNPGGKILITDHFLIGYEGGGAH